MKLRLILNGKKAGLEPVRNAVFQAREQTRIEVRPTWEAGDVHRLVREALAENCERIVAGGGDGTVNEVIDALMQLAPDERPELAILPLGTANDFATACKIPDDPYQALLLAVNGSSHSVDTVKANQRHFINVASAGFGAQVTANTPVILKNFLGGGAYTLAGLVQAVNFSPYPGTASFDGKTVSTNLIVGAVCNGSHAGGGQVLAPKAKIDDGKLDIIGINQFPAENLSQVIRELMDENVNGDYVIRFQAKSVEWNSEEPMPVNLDGEPISEKQLRFELVPSAVRLVAPDDCPLLNSQ